MQLARQYCGGSYNGRKYWRSSGPYRLVCSISRSEILSILTEADVQVHECELRATGGNAQRQAHKSNGIRELTLTPAIRFTWLTAFTTNLFGFQATHV